MTADPKMSSVDLRIEVEELERHPDGSWTDLITVRDLNHPYEAKAKYDSLELPHYGINRVIADMVAALLEEGGYDIVKRKG